MEDVILSRSDHPILKLSDIAARLDCRLDGDGTIEIVRVAAIDRAGPGDLTFLANAKYHAHLATTRASAVIVGDAQSIDTPHSFAVLRNANPYLAFARALSLMASASRPPVGVDRLAAIAKDASVGADASIGPFVVVGAHATVGARTVIYPNAVIGEKARIGDDCVIHAGVSIRDRVTIGHRVTILDGAVIGSDGFGFVRQPDGTHLKVPQTADVVIEDDVEIGANTTIDRPAVGETRIQAGTKIDNLVQIAHGVAIGRRGLIASQVGIAGSTGDRRRRDAGGAGGCQRSHSHRTGSDCQREDRCDTGRRAWRLRVRLSVHAQCAVA